MVDGIGREGAAIDAGRGGREEAAEMGIEGQNHRVRAYVSGSSAADITNSSDVRHLTIGEGAASFASHGTDGRANGARWSNWQWPESRVLLLFQLSARELLRADKA